MTERLLTYLSIAVAVIGLPTLALLIATAMLR